MTGHHDSLLNQLYTSTREDDEVILPDKPPAPLIQDGDEKLRVHPYVRSHEDNFSENVNNSEWKC